MAYTRGRCTNLDYCSLAAARQDLEVRVGDDFICPECAKPLRPPPTRQGGSGATNLAIAGGAVALLLIGGGIYAGYRLSSSSATPARIAALALPAAAQASPATSVPQAATTSRQPAAAAPSVPGTPSVLLRVATPPALAHGLAAGLATAYLAALGDTDIAVQAGPAGELRVTGQRLSRPETITLLPAPQAGGSQGRFAALASGRADVVLADARVTQSELDQARSLGDLAAPDSEHALGQQAEAVVVSPQNPLRQLTMAQLRAILDGSTTSWRALGVSGPAIHVLAETNGPKPADLVAGLGERTARITDVADAPAAIAADPAGVALVPAAHAGGARVLAIAAVGARPALPVAASVEDGAYPLAQRVYLYAPAANKNPFAQRFAAFAMSAEGQLAVQQAGLVPATLAAAPANPAPATPKDRYKALVKGATQLSAALHFEPNSNKLDHPSSTNVDRIWNLMESDHTPANHLILIGFADNQGEAEANTTLAKQRAEAVASVFARRGLPPGEVVSFGSDLPIADNTSEEGRQRNRRVEVFLLP